jgi:hypothetical protein
MIDFSILCEQLIRAQDAEDDTLVTAITNQIRDALKQLKVEKEPAEKSNALWEILDSAAGQSLGPNQWIIILSTLQEELDIERVFSPEMNLDDVKQWLQDEVLVAAFAAVQ